MTPETRSKRASKIEVVRVKTIAVTGAKLEARDYNASR
jgi:hypothetical protein